MTYDAATTRDTYVPHTRRAVLHEAMQLVVDGDPELAAWSLAWHTNHLAGLSDSSVTLDDAWAAFTACTNRLTEEHNERWRDGGYTSDVPDVATA